MSLFERLRTSRAGTTLAAVSGRLHRAATATTRTALDRFDRLRSPAAPEPATSAVRRLSAAFEARFPGAARSLRFFSASGRINLLGEHTDYSEGLCLPAAIDRRIEGAFQVAEPGTPDARTIRLYSGELGEPVEVLLDAIPDLPEGTWGRYVASAAKVLSEHLGPRASQLRGFSGVIQSDIPMGSGLSSSAALELLVLSTLAKLSGIELPRQELIQLGQKAEWEYGVKCGILDQFAIGNGKKGEVSLIDCRSLTARPIQVDLGDYQLLIGFTKERTLGGSEYNTRRQECQAALEALRTLSADQELQSLRDVTPELLSRHADAFAGLPNGATLLKRARHVVSENARVLEAVQALQAGDVQGFGKLLLETHRSLSQDFEVSCPELDAMVDAAVQFGKERGRETYARMMGGGFGGPALILVPRELAAEAKLEINRLYRERTGREGKFWDVEIEDGLQELTA